MAKPTILVVSNEELPFGSASPIARGGEQVIRAMTGAEALGLISGYTPKLAILPSSLEDIDAPLFCRTVRDDEATRSTSLLVVLDEDDETMGDLCIAAGCNEVIRRPIDEADFDEKIARLTSIPVRKELRTLVKLELNIEKKQLELLLGNSINVSKSGMLVQTSHILEPEAAVTLRFFLQHDPEPMQVESRVVRAEFAGGAPRYGMRFVRMAASHREKLEQFIDHLRAARPGGKEH